MSGVFLMCAGFFTTVVCESLTIALQSNGLPCESEIFCHGLLLESVQLAEPRIFNDSKEFVDFPLKSSAQEILGEFRKLWNDSQSAGHGNLTRAAVDKFVWEHFDNRDMDLPVHTPVDWKDVSSGGLPMYRNITDGALQQFAKVIHDKWRDLGRDISDEIKLYSDRHSLIYIPHPFIVPGGRFDEIYYWDSLWVIQGLLASNMPDTAKGMIQNFAHLIHEYGHVLNGNRVYYIKRSQPPVLAIILDHYYSHDNVPSEDRLALVREILPALEREHRFWMESRNISITKNGKTYQLNVYRGGITTPRPESYREDHETAKRYSYATKNDDVGGVFANIAAAAESGWDFSTRWLDSRESEFHTIRTETIVPVDLNAFLCAQERLMSKFYRLTGNDTLAAKYSELALDRGDALQEVFWNPDVGLWRDYDSKLNKSRDHFYLSDVTPIFAKCSGRSKDVLDPDFLKKLVQSPDVSLRPLETSMEEAIRSSLRPKAGTIQYVTSFPGGFPTSKYHSATNCCQWDFPNAWPPLQMIMIEDLSVMVSSIQGEERSVLRLNGNTCLSVDSELFGSSSRNRYDSFGDALPFESKSFGTRPTRGKAVVSHHGFAYDKDLREIVVGWAQKWVSAVYDGFAQHGHLYEKYDVTKVGEYGFGGEYEVQLGFGWTNGGILRLLELFPKELQSGIVNGGLTKLGHGSLTVISIAAVYAFLISVCLPRMFYI